MQIICIYMLIYADYRYNHPKLNFFCLGTARLKKYHNKHHLDSSDFIIDRSLKKVHLLKVTILLTSSIKISLYLIYGINDLMNK